MGRFEEICLAEVDQNLFPTFCTNYFTEWTKSIDGLTKAGKYSNELCYLPRIFQNTELRANYSPV